VTGKIGPEYQRLIDQIRAQITAGEYPVGQLIPSTSGLASLTGMSIPVIRRAVQQLQADGILEGHPGKGVYVKAMPEEADAEHQDVRALGGQVADNTRELQTLQETVSRLEAYLIDLGGKVGHPYPRDKATAPGSRQRPRRAASA
jgi:DNA-binding FadR family transcriptional regulator